MTAAEGDAPAADDEPKPSRGGLARGLAIGAAGMVLPILGLVMIVRSCSRTAVSGEVAVTLASGARGWREPLNRCKSGELQSFTGVDLGRDVDGKMLVRAQLDPDRGPLVDLTPPTGGAPLHLTAATCPGLRIDVKKVGKDGDGAALLDGRVVARCTLPAGEVVQLDGWWKRCGTD